jgi:hypothetical protein
MAATLNVNLAFGLMMKFVLYGGICKHIYQL